jgi:CBS domain-containing protein
VSPATPLAAALGLLLEAGLSALPVVDGGGGLVDCYARGDITALARGGAYSRLQWEDVTVGQALALAPLPPAGWGGALGPAGGARLAPAAFRAALLAAHGLEGRFFFSRGKDYPTGVFSVIAYDLSLEQARIDSLTPLSDAVVPSAVPPNRTLASRARRQPAQATLATVALPTSATRSVKVRQTRTISATLHIAARLTSPVCKTSNATRF